MQYLHVVISPGRRGEFGNEDFKALAAPWVRDGSGRTFEHFGAVHYDDREGPKLHLVVARDKLKTPELVEAKERSDGICRERGRLIDRDRAPEREPEREPDRGPKRDEGPGVERD